MRPPQTTLRGVTTELTIIEDPPIVIEEASRSRGVRIAQWLVLAAPVAAFAVLAYTHRILSDDGFINLRIVNQILAGHGPVFNQGQRVEAFTSPLWLAVLVVAEALTPIRAEYLAVGIGIVGSVAGLALSIVGARELLDPTGRTFVVPAGALVPLGVLGAWYFASSGLETGLVSLWVGASLWVLARWANRDRLPAWSAVLLGLGWLIRPDLGLVSLAFVVALLATTWRSWSWGRRVQLVAWMFALPFAYEIFRMGYYGNVLPNTALAKEANAVHWGRGWQYVLSTVNPYWLWVPLVLLGVFAYAPLLSRFARDQHSRGIAVVLAFVVGGLLDATYTIRVGGDYFHARLLLPALLAFCAPVAVIPLRRAAAGAALVLAWAITVGVSTTGPYSHFRSTYKIGMTANQRGWGRNGPARAWYTGPALYVQGIRLDDAPAANVKLPAGFQWGIGVSGYAMGTKFNVLDGFGLADPIDAHFHLDHAGFPGHEKPMPGAWAAARMTAPGSHVDAVQFPPPALVPTMIPVATGAAFDRQVADARAALQCRPIVDLERSYTGHLTVRRFFSNMFHSVHNATFRIPPDPTEARAKLCHS